MQIDRDELAAGFPTWAERAPGHFGGVNVFRIEGDPRNAWRRFKDQM